MINKVETRFKDIRNVPSKEGVMRGLNVAPLSQASQSAVRSQCQNKKIFSKEYTIRTDDYSEKN